MLIWEFDRWIEGYDGVTVSIFVGDTATLADCFYDEGLSVPAPNPIELSSLTLDDLSFGKFPQPIYVGSSYHWEADNGTQGGVQRLPILTAQGLNISTSIILPQGATVTHTAAELAGRLIFAEDFGDFSTVGADNTTIITAAIGAAAGQGGGTVLFPAERIVFTDFSIPDGVFLKGAGKASTVFESAESQAVVTLTGNDCGFIDCTLDGVNLAADSVGIEIRNRKRITFRNFKVMRFETGIDAKGATECDWQDFDISNCGTNLKAHGDTTDSGGVFEHNSWVGGRCELSSVAGLDLSFEDAEVSFNSFSGVVFDSNAKAIRANGARFTTIDEATFTNNEILVDLLDDTATTGNNKVLGFRIKNSILDTGAVNLRDTCGDVSFENCDVKGITFTLTTVSNAVRLVNCVEDSAVAINDDGTKLIREFLNLQGSTKGVTTGSAATKALSVKLQPGEMICGRVMATGKQRDGIDTAGYVFSVIAQKAPDTLAYDAQSVNFSVGKVLTGGTSGATGRIIADSDGGTTGTLTLHTINGVFVDNELITDTNGGSATANGALVAGSVTIRDQDVQSLYESDSSWDCAAAGSVDEVEIRVTGATNKIIDWTVHGSWMRYG